MLSEVPERGFSTVNMFSGVSERDFSTVKMLSGVPERDFSTCKSLSGVPERKLIVLICENPRNIVITRSKKSFTTAKNKFRFHNFDKFSSVRVSYNLFNKNGIKIKRIYILDVIDMKYSVNTFAAKLEVIK
jgi:hypothetical protein